jgi:hypothetical protein
VLNTVEPNRSCRRLTYYWARYPRSPRIDGPNCVSFRAGSPVNSTLTATLQASPKVLSTFATARIIYAMSAWVWSGATVH